MAVLTLLVILFFTIFHFSTFAIFNLFIQTSGLPIGLLGPPIWLPFGSLLAPVGSLLVPFWLPFGSPWSSLGSLLVPYMPICLHPYMPICLHAYMPICLYAYMPTCLYAYMPIWLYAYMPICHTYRYTAKHKNDAA